MNKIDISLLLIFLLVIVVSIGCIHFIPYFNDDDSDDNNDDNSNTNKN